MNQKNSTHEDTFWRNEERKYYEFIKKNPGKTFDHFFPEKIYPAYRTAQIIWDLIKGVKKPSVLEPGCGIAISLCLLANKHVNCVGIDTSRASLKFAKLLKSEYLTREGHRNLTLSIDDFYNFNYERKFDLIFNSGVLEHYTKNKQLLFLKKIKELSSKYVIIMIPNTNSLIFKNFLSQMQKQSRKYSEKHIKIDVEGLFERAGIDLIKKTGRHIWSKNYTPRNAKLSNIYSKYFSWVQKNDLIINRNIIKKLALSESEISDKVLYTHAFTKIYIGKV